MKNAIVIVSVVALILYVIYRIYFREYVKMRSVFRTLRRFLDARDTMVLKIVPEVKDKKLSKEVLKMIEERKLNFTSGHNHAILSDIKLNATLKIFYEKYNQKEKNELEKEIFSEIIRAEKNLKHLRKEYNTAVLRYNQMLVQHKMVCMKLIKMKPLDTYGSQKEL